jgi:hypothetical protein
MRADALPRFAEFVRIGGVGEIIFDRQQLLPLARVATVLLQCGK